MSGTLMQTNALIDAGRQSRRRILLVDGTNIAIFAAFGGDIEPARSTSSALTAIECAIAQAGATHLIIAFDGEQETFRKAIASDYKAGRTTKTQPWVHALREACDSRGWLSITVEGFEADDVVATLASRLSGDGWPVVIYTGDSDALSLITSMVAVLRPLKVREAKRWRAEDVEAKYGVRPEQLADLKALMGEKGDNIAGVPGIGLRKAAGLLHRYGSLERILVVVPERPDKDLTQVRTHHQLARRARELTTLRVDVPLPDLVMPSCTIPRESAT